jgi:4-diphosphocytidyl-2-C-methyl-D-erythritol kinase
VADAPAPASAPALSAARGLDPGFAPAKVNLALHVTARGADGYHRLDSLVVFAGTGDQLSATPSRDLSLAVSGPFASGLPGGEDNIVLRAARALRSARGVEKGAAIRLVKTLPQAAGLGGGSSDAAAALRLLARLWDVEPLSPDAPEVLALGSDVPVCLQAPVPARMRGRGEVVDPLPPLPPCGLVLVNPGAPLATAEVFARLDRPDNPPLPDLPPGRLSPEGLAGWLRGTRNDLQAPAEALAPPVAEALAQLRRTPGILHAVMSGSGATCVGLCRDMAVARTAARTIQIARPRWWVAPAALLQPEPARSPG